MNARPTLMSWKGAVAQWDLLRPALRNVGIGEVRIRVGAHDGDLCLALCFAGARDQAGSGLPSGTGAASVCVTRVTRISLCVPTSLSLTILVHV